MNGNGRNKLIVLQFMIANSKVIPAGIPSKKNVEKKETSSTGSLILENTENVDVSTLMEELAKNNYQLVDVFQEERHHQKGGKSYFIVRFSFADGLYATPSEDFKKVRVNMLNALQRLIEMNFWKVRGFRNPFFEDGNKAKGQSVLSIDLAQRVPRFDGNGQPVLVWVKDIEGNHLGDAPIPISPAGTVHLERDGLAII